MDFDCSDVQRAWRDKGRSLGRELSEDAVAADVVMGAARVGLLDARADLVAAALAVEALAAESAAAGMALALHTAAILALAGDDRPASRSSESEGWLASLVRGETVGALTLSTEDFPSVEGSSLHGRASWVGPITERGIAIVGARQGSDITACAVPLDAKGVSVATVTTSALRGFTWAYVTFAGAPGITVGTPWRIMAGARVLISAAALGIGNRALRES